ncbi:hypothetical protein MMC17_002728 [Xylographa soralifera]|nr:hypothetical protein [Xylographa soralifera]
MGYSDSSNTLSQSPLPVSSEAHIPSTLERASDSQQEQSIDDPWKETIVLSLDHNNIVGGHISLFMLEEIMKEIEVAERMFDPHPNEDKYPLLPYIYFDFMFGSGFGG